MFDTKCLDLAKSFLYDEDSALRVRAEELAQVIQDAIEEWIEEERQPKV